MPTKKAHYKKQIKNSNFSSFLEKDTAVKNFMLFALLILFPDREMMYTLFQKINLFIFEMMRKNISKTKV